MSAFASTLQNFIIFQKIEILTEVEHDEKVVRFSARETENQCQILNDAQRSKEFSI